jgi:hypothetical protein
MPVSLCNIPKMPCPIAPLIRLFFLRNVQVSFVETVRVFFLTMGDDKNFRDFGIIFPYGQGFEIMHVYLNKASS